MSDYLRLRQICLVAPDLAPAERAITDVLGLAVCYRDPQVAKYGLENALWPVGDMFLEVVAPTRPDTAAGRFLARSGGRGGYMVIFDCSDPGRRAAQARAMGICAVTEVTHDAYTGVQLHPRDCRAAMIEFNHTAGGDADPSLYAPARPDWRRARRDDVTRKINAVELATPDPEGLAQHWAEIIERPLEHVPPKWTRFGDKDMLKRTLRGAIPYRPRDSTRSGSALTGKTTFSFAETELRFVASEDGGERLSTLRLSVVDPKAMQDRARTAGLVPTARGFLAAGIEWIPEAV